MDREIKRAYCKKCGVPGGKAYFDKVQIEDGSIAWKCRCCYSITIISYSREAVEARKEKLERIKKLMGELNAQYNA